MDRLRISLFFHFSPFELYLMELEFDKEIDAILRRTGRGVLVGDDPPNKPKHVDADEIAAFVENALPAKTRALYMEHFADCDHCRRILSHSILLFSEAAPEDASFAAPIVEVTVPWYRKLLRTPNLAIAMGALVLVFSGVLGFMVLRNRQAANNSSVAQVTEQERSPSGPSFSANSAETTPASAANTIPAPVANAANTNALSAAPAPGSVSATPAEPAVGRSAPTAAKPDLSLSAGVPADAEITAGEDKPKEEEPIRAAKGAPAPPPQPAIVTDGVTAGREKKDADTKDADDERFSAKRKQTEELRSRDLPPAPAKTGPARSGPLNNQQNQIATQNITEMPVTRVVGGKTFNNRNGAWYDSAYRNQATMNFRRGTDEYKKLDSGLRSIADSLGGAVVIIWKDRAYRIN